MENIPEDGHGPVLTYLTPIKDVIIECEFRLSTKDVVDRHFRIFLDNPEYGGHTIAAWANVSTVFRPKGLTLFHNPKVKGKTPVKAVDIGPQSWHAKVAGWHKMTLVLIGDKARVIVDAVELDARIPGLDTTKNKIGLNPGKAGGEVRNFKAWKALKP